MGELLSKRRNVGPFSKCLGVGSLDRRTKEGMYVNNLLDALYEQMGRPPTAGQQIVAQQLAVKMLRCELMMPRLLSGEDLTGHPAHMFIAWSNSTRRDLEALGLLSDNPVQQRSLADTLRDLTEAALDAAD
jgi:hypothetical protein